MRELFQRFRRFLRELRRRKVYRVAAAYVAVALGLWQAASIAAPALRLPSWTVPLVVVLTLLGFPVAVVLAWGWELTPEGVRRTASREDGEVRLEVPAGAREPGAPGDESRRGLLWRHSRAVTVGVAVGLLTVVSIGVWTAVQGPNVPPPAEEGRLGVAVFPFRSSGAPADLWVEGAPDLLTTALEGTAGLRVVDPWSLWRPLRSGTSAQATPPDRQRAASLARDAGAHRYLLGSVVQGTAGAHLTLRLYSIHREEPLETLRVDVRNPDDVGAAVRRAALDLLPVLSRDADGVGVGSELRFAVTDSPEALQAYLAAREAMRRGQFDSADVALDRALSVDSTFVLANVAAVSIKSWVDFLYGQPITGLTKYVERAESRAGDVKEPIRLRIQVARAQIETHGEECAESARQLIRRDTADLQAWSDLRHCHQVYGWQYGADLDDTRRAAGRVLELDSTFVPALVSRALMAVANGPADPTEPWLERLQALDSGAPVVEGMTLGLQAARADSAAFDSLASRVADAPTGVWVQVLRVLRTRWPDRSRLLLERRLESLGPADEAEIVWMEGIRGLLARGAVARVDSALEAGRFPNWRMMVNRWLATAALAGLGDREKARRAAGELRDFIPADSAVAYFERARVWQTGWAVAAVHALWGDTAVTKRWRETIGELPGGGTATDYRGSLQAELDARLALRRGDSASALGHAREAYRLWGIHASTTFESYPEPMTRLLLGLLHRRAGRSDSARSMFRSLVPPVTWMGFLTTRAWSELGRIALERNRPERAVAHLEPAVRYLEGGDREVVDPYLSRAREALAEARDDL